MKINIYLPNCPINRVKNRQFIFGPYDSISYYKFIVRAYCSNGLVNSDIRSEYKVIE